MISRGIVSKSLLLFIAIGLSQYVFSQVSISGRVVDSDNQNALGYVNIGIKEKNIGTVSKQDGTFSIIIPTELYSDSLSFSLVGYYEFTKSINDIISTEKLVIDLKEKITRLDEVIVKGDKLVEKKYGIKKRGLIHFTDGIFRKNDSFEIGQIINLGHSLAQITSINLHINSTRQDSASFRINFYRYDEDENIPKERLIERSILQRHPIHNGWLKFDLSEHNILLKGKILASIEFIPEDLKDINKILYEIRIGGISKSFFRRNSFGQWVRPPHHYCLYVTALTDKNALDEPDDLESVPTITMTSEFANEPFSLFVKLPKGYSKDTGKTYPVIYLLDGNAFFDPIADFVNGFSKKRKPNLEAIIVGIGYENAYVMDSLRDRDYTYPIALPKDSFRVSGQGENFYNFIRTKVIPVIDIKYRTDKENRTIMGHSLGGYFVLFALTRNWTYPSLFTNYIAASPSLLYHDNYLIKLFENSSNNEDHAKRTKLYLTIGELETTDKKSTEFTYLHQILETRSTMLVRTKMYKNLEHMGTAIISFEDGIKFVLNK